MLVQHSNIIEFLWDVNSPLQFPIDCHDVHEISPFIRSKSWEKRCSTNSQEEMERYTCPISGKLSHAMMVSWAFLRCLLKSL